MNLGQLIGELQSGAVELGKPLEPVVGSAPREPSEREQQVLDLLKDGVPLTTNAISLVLDISVTGAGVLMIRMMDRGMVRKLNDKRPFLYGLPA